MLGYTLFGAADGRPDVVGTVGATKDLKIGAH
jgi:hypothetical protein